MKIELKRIYFLIAILMLIAPFKAQSQKPKVDAVDIEAMRVLFMIQFVENLTWKDTPPGDTLTIGILDYNTVFYKNLLSAVKYTKQYKVKVVQFYKIAEVEPTHILYVAQQFNVSVRRIWKSLKDTHTVIVTDEYWNEKYTMINFEYSYYASRLRYNLYTENFNLEEIKIGDDIKIAGAGQNEVREMLYVFSDTLNYLKKQQEILQKSLDLQEREIGNQSEVIEKQGKEIRRQLDSLEIQKKRIEKEKQKYAQQLELVKSLNQQVNSYKSDIESKRQILERQQQREEIQDTRLSKQEQKILASDSILNQRIIQIMQKNATIDKLSVDLSEKMSKVKEQTNTIYGFIAILIVIAILVLFLIRNIRKKKRVENILQLKNQELLQQSEELSFQAENLQKLNEELEQQRKKAEDALVELRSTQAQLIQSEKMASIGQLTAGIAHEINNPVNYINAGIDALKDIIEQFVGYIEERNAQDSEPANGQNNDFEHEELMEGLYELTNSIKVGAKRTTEIVKGLRTFTRTGKNQLITTNIHKNIDSTLLMVHHMYRDSVEVIKNYGKIPEIQCYPEKLNQVFMNLIVNAIQAIEKKGKIEICTSVTVFDIHIKDIKAVKVTISDTGKGIPKAIKDKIFDPFFTTKEIGEGTGLGLSISYNIIEEHNGRITLDSEEGKGTTFTIYLPIVQQ